MVVVDEIDTQSAMSSVHFRQGWHQRIKHRISSILHTVRPHRSSRSVGQTSDDRYGPASAPHLPGDRERPDTKRHGAEPHKTAKGVSHKDKGKGIDPLEKGKDRTKNRPKSARNESGSTAASTSAGRSRRGSETLAVPESWEYVSHSPETSSPTSVRTGDDHPFGTKRQGYDRPRSRFSVRSFRERWRPHKTPSHGSTPPEPSTSALSSGAESYPQKFGREGQRSTEAIYPPRYSPVRFARRASSWADGEYEDVLSLNSGGDDEGPARDTVMFGAGGVVNGPTYGTSTQVGLTRAAAATSDITSTRRQATPPDAGMYDTIFDRQAQIRSQNASPSPLAVTAYRRNVDLEQTCDEVSDDDSLSYGEIVRSDQYQNPLYPHALSTSSSQISEDDTEEDSEEEYRPMEIRRRRPSVAVTPAPPLSS